MSKKIPDAILSDFGYFWAYIFFRISKFLPDAASDAVDAASDLADSTGVTDFVDNAGDAISGAWLLPLWKKKVLVLGAADAASSAGDMASDAWDAASDAVSDAASSAGDAISGAWLLPL